MPTGTSIVVSTSPATTSCRSQLTSYCRSVTSPGSQRIQPIRFSIRKLSECPKLLSVQPLASKHRRVGLLARHSPRLSPRRGVLPRQPLEDIVRQTAGLVVERRECRLRRASPKILRLTIAGSLDHFALERFEPGAFYGATRFCRLTRGHHTTKSEYRPVCRHPHLNDAAGQCKARNQVGARRAGRQDDQVASRH